MKQSKNDIPILSEQMISNQQQHKNYCYDYVDKPIADILTAQPEDDDTTTVGTSNNNYWKTIIDPSTLCLRHDWKEQITFQSRSRQEVINNNNNNSNNDNDNMLDMPTLTLLASLCEQAIFLDDDSSTITTRPIPKSMVTLCQAVEEEEANNNDDDSSGPAHVVIGTQLVLGILESEIRELLCKQAGKAPLLKDMIEAIGKGSFLPSSDNINNGQIITSTTTINHESLAHALRALLLPKGINLRNLIWHGFLSHLDRRWLALSVVLFVSTRKLVEDTHGVSGDKKASSTMQELPRPVAIEKERLEAKRKDEVNLRQYSELCLLLDYGQTLYKELVTLKSEGSTSDTSLPHLRDSLFVKSSFLPQSYIPLLRIVMADYISSPACFAAIMSPLIEHGVRLLWCEANNRQDAKKAHVGEYYVTLDGIGQLDKHDMMLLPYIIDRDESSMSCDATSSGGTPSRLVHTLGGTLLSLLADIFASPCGGPNLRSAMAHGIWDDILLAELEERGSIADGPANSTDQECQRVTSSPLADTTYILIAVFYMLCEQTMKGSDDPVEQQQLSPLASKALCAYRPTFSYSSSMLRNLDSIIDSLGRLRFIINTDYNMQKAVDGMQPLQSEVAKSIHNLVSELGVINEESISKLKKELLEHFDIGNIVVAANSESRNNIWMEQDVFREYDCSAVLADCGAARMLLSDVADGANNYLRELEEGLRLAKEDANGNNNKRESTAAQRRKKKFERVCSLAGIVMDLYTLCSNIALWHIERYTKEANNELFDTVRRSRMVVSTFSNQLNTNADRAVKAVKEFMGSKAVKKLMKSRTTRC